MDDRRFLNWLEAQMRGVDASRHDLGPNADPTSSECALGCDAGLMGMLSMTMVNKAGSALGERTQSRASNFERLLGHLLSVRAVIRKKW